jgi:hypothetical protein
MTSPRRARCRSETLAALHKKWPRPFIQGETPQAT